MKPVPISGATHRIRKGPLWGGPAFAHCAGLTMREIRDGFETHWKPDEKELAALNAGGVVVLRVWGEHPAVALSAAIP